MIIDSVLANIEKGRSGGNRGLNMGYPRLSEYVPGVQPGTIYSIGASTGAGKTSFAMSSFIYSPFEDYKDRMSKGEDIKLKIFLYSFEMHPDIVITKGICRRLFKEYKIITDIGYVLSRGKNRISQEIYDKVLETRKYFEEFEEVVTILGAENPTGISKLLKGYYLNNGTEVRHPITIKEDGQDKTINIFDRYIPNHPNSYTIVMFDHISLTKSQQGMNVKETIDKVAEYCVGFTNDYNQSTVFVQQLNRNNENIDRQKMQSIDAQLSDFRDSSNIQHASHYVFTLTNPVMYEIPLYRGYDIKKLQDRFRGFRILKSRDGTSNVSLGLIYLGEVGMFKEAKPADQMTQADYDAITKLKKTITQI